MGTQNSQQNVWYLMSKIRPTFIYAAIHTYTNNTYVGLGLPGSCKLLLDPTPRQIAAIIIPASILGAFDVSAHVHLPLLFFVN
jgi:hypothetical protein